MTSTFKLSDFQSQLQTSLSGVFRPDDHAAALVNNFVSLGEQATVDDFNGLVSSLTAIKYASLKSQTSFLPVINLLVAQQAYLMSQAGSNAEPTETQDVSALEAIIGAGAVATSGNIVMKCVGKPGEFSLEPINDAFNSLMGYNAASAACMEFSKTAGDLYLTLTGDVGACQGPYEAANAYYYCMSGI